MDLPSLPQTALALIWGFLGDTENCQAFRCSCRAAWRASDGLIHSLDLPGDVEDDEEGIPALQRFPRRAVLRSLVIANGSISDLLDKILASSLVDRLHGVLELTLDNFEVRA